MAYLVGPSQTKKTSLARELTAIYNRNTPPAQPDDVSLLPTNAAIFDALGPYRDCVRLVDDLYRSGSRSETRRRDEKLDQIIRLVGNNAQKGRGRAGEEDSVNCGIICTAEYLPEGFSTLTRCLILQLERPLPSARLTKIQCHPLTWPTFLYRFLTWVAAHYDAVVGYLRQQFPKLRQQRAAQPVQEERLREFQWALHLTTDILGAFFSSQLPSHLSGTRKQLVRLIKRSINQAIQHQTELLAHERDHSDTNSFSRALSELHFGAHMVHITEKPGKKF